MDITILTGLLRAADSPPLALSINLGTRTINDDLTADQEALPSKLRMKLQPLDGAVKVATDSEGVTSDMRCLAAANMAHFERFSDYTGVAWVGLGDWERIRDIRRMTEEHLAIWEEDQKLDRCAKGTAADYFARRHGRNPEVMQMEN